MGSLGLGMGREMAILLGQMMKVDRGREAQSTASVSQQVYEMSRGGERACFVLARRRRPRLKEDFTTLSSYTAVKITIILGT